MPAYQSKFTGEEIDAMLDELIAARGQRSALNNRLSTISNFASPNGGGNIPGRIYDQAFHAAGTSTYTNAADRLDLIPFYLSQPFNGDIIGLNVTTAGAAGTLAKCVIYSSENNGWPASPVVVSPDLDCTTTGSKFANMAFSLESGRQYWAGVLANATFSLTAIPTSSMANLGLSGFGSTGNNAYGTAVRKGMPFAGGPVPWGSMDTASIVAISGPSVRMRSV